MYIQFKTKETEIKCKFRENIHYDSLNILKYRCELRNTSLQLLGLNISEFYQNSVLTPLLVLGTIMLFKKDNQKYQLRFKLKVNNKKSINKKLFPE